jgi:hypothetical protein
MAYFKEIFRRSNSTEISIRNVSSLIDSEAGTSVGRQSLGRDGRY